MPRQTVQNSTTTISGARRIGPDRASAETASGSTVTESTRPSATIDSATVSRLTLTPPSRRIPSTDLGISTRFVPTWRRLIRAGLIWVVHLCLKHLRGTLTPSPNRRKGGAWRLGLIVPCRRPELPISKTLESFDGVVTGQPKELYFTGFIASFLFSAATVSVGI